MLTPTQRKISDIVECHENSSPNKYGGIVVIRGDTGGTSGGELMASLTSGSLGQLCRLYATKGGKCIPESLIVLAEQKNALLNSSVGFKNSWVVAARDPLMWEAQDEFFYGRYEYPAELWCKEHGFTLPLTIAIVMDAKIHGSFDLIASKIFVEDEKAWAASYVMLRRDWLANHKNPVLHTTTYRMDTFQGLIDTQNWNLTGPLQVHVGKSVVTVT